MSVASSVPCLRVPTSSSCCSSSSSSNPSNFRISRTKLSPFTVTCSQADGPIRRPVAPPLREPSPPSTVKPVPPSPPQPSPPSPPSSSVAQPPKPAAAVEDKNVVTLEFQRQKAKELQEYFKQKKLEEANVGPFFGFIGKNEIANGR